MKKGVWLFFIFLMGCTEEKEGFPYKEYRDQEQFHDAIHNLISPGMRISDVKKILHTEGIKEHVDKRDQKIFSYRYSYNFSKWWMPLIGEYWIVVLHVEPETGAVLSIEATNHGFTGP